VIIAAELELAATLPLASKGSGAAKGLERKLAVDNNI
jgi:hypothetical protein